MLKPSDVEIPNPMLVYAASFRREPWYKLLILIPLSPLVLLLVGFVQSLWLFEKWTRRRERRRWEALPPEEKQKWAEIQARIDAGVRLRLGSAQENPATE